MKKLIIVITMMALVSSSLLALPTQALRVPRVRSHSHTNSQPINQDDISRLDRVDQKLNKFLKVYQEDSATVREVREAAIDARLELDTLKGVQFSKGLGDGYLKAADGIKAKAGELAELLKQLVTSLRSSNDAQTKEFLNKQFPDKFNNALKEYHAAIEALNKAVDEANKSQARTHNLLYLGQVAVAVIVAVAAFVWAFRKKEPTASLTKARRLFAYCSVVPVIATGIMYGSSVMSGTVQTGKDSGMSLLYTLVLVGVGGMIHAGRTYYRLKKELAASGAPQPGASL